MTTRRKYRQRADLPAEINVAVAPAPASPAPPPSPPGGDGASPFASALAAQQHAEHLQAQHAQRQQIGLQEPPISPEERAALEANIAAAPGLTDWQRRFLSNHVSLTKEPFLSLLGHAIALARHAGITPDTPQFDAAILHNIARDIESHHQLRQFASASARPDVPVPITSPPDGDQHIPAPQEAAPMPPSPPRRSMPMSAPVSRNAPEVSGRPAPNNTLSRDEREIARASWPHLPPAQAEYEYLRNKRRMHQAKADGLIQGDR